MPNETQRKGDSTMSAKELAALLNGRPYPLYIHREERERARASRLVVVYGHSDDLLEFDGAIYEEVGAYNGGKAQIVGDRLIEEPDQDEREILEKFGVLDQVANPEGAVTVTAKWNAEGYSWYIEADALFEPFDVLDGENRFCRGIVLDLNALPG